MTTINHKMLRNVPQFQAQFPGHYVSFVQRWALKPVPEWCADNFDDDDDDEPPFQIKFIFNHHHHYPAHQREEAANQKNWVLRLQLEHAHDHY